MDWIYWVAGGFAGVMLAAGIGLLWAGVSWTAEPDRAPRRYVSEGDS